MVSMMQKPEIVRDYPLKKCAEGWVLALTRTVSKHTNQRDCSNPKRSTGKWHHTVDLSAPEGYSTNDNTDETLCSLSYISLDSSCRNAQI